MKMVDKKLDTRKSEIRNPYLVSVHNLWEGGGDQEKGGGDPLSMVLLWVTPYKIIYIRRRRTRKSSVQILKFPSHKL